MLTNAKVGLTTIACHSPFYHPLSLPLTQCHHHAFFLHHTEPINCNCYFFCYYKKRKIESGPTKASSLLPSPVILNKSWSCCFFSKFVSCVFYEQGEFLSKKRCPPKKPVPQISVTQCPSMQFSLLCRVLLPFASPQMRTNAKKIIIFTTDGNTQQHNVTLTSFLAYSVKEGDPKCCKILTVSEKREDEEKLSHSMCR